MIQSNGSAGQQTTDRIDSTRLSPFDEMYNRENVAFGCQPSPVLGALLRDLTFTRTKNAELRGIDLGCGTGRDTLAMARSRIRVKAFDTCPTGIERLKEESRSCGLADYVSAVRADVREVELEPESFDYLVATTVLDHLPLSDAVILWRQMCCAIRPNGFLYVEVHLDEDPGAGRALPDQVGGEALLPTSESADKVINYFHSGQLLRWLHELPVGLRVLHYEEPWEWDTTHGAPHVHRKAILLVTTKQNRFCWRGRSPRGDIPQSIGKTIAGSA